MLAKTYKQQLEKMLAREDIKGKGLLKQFIWMNEVEPKFKKGTFVTFTSRGLSNFGHPVKNFAGEVTDITLWPKDKIIHYQITYTVSINGLETTHTAYCNESEISGKTRQRVNKFDKKLTEDSDAIHI